MQDIKNNNIENLIAIFRDQFSFDYDEIKQTINQILQNNDQRLIDTLANIMREFVSGHNSNLTKKERSILGKQIIKNCLDIYNDENTLINQEFAKVLQMAKAQSIDIYRFAIKTNIRSASVEKFSKSLYALCQKQYYDKFTGSYSTLFSQAEVSSIINDCAYIACKLKEENIQKVLSILSELSFDKERNYYFFNPKELIKKNKTLLLANPGRIKENIKFLQNLGQSQGLSKMQILNEIILSPSILTINHNKLAEFEQVYKAGLVKILPNNQESEMYAQSVAHETAYNFSKLNTIQNIKLENIEKNIVTLTRFLGKENAIGFSKNLTFLSKNPKFVEYLMLRASQEENNGIKDFRKYIVEHSSNLTGDLTKDYPIIKKREMGLSINIPHDTKINFKVSQDLPQSGDVDREIQEFVIDGKTRKQVEDIIEKYKSEKTTSTKQRKETKENTSAKKPDLMNENEFKNFIMNFNYNSADYPTYSSLIPIYPLAKALENGTNNLAFDDIRAFCDNVSILGLNHSFYKNQLEKIAQMQGKIKGLTGTKYKKRSNEYDTYINSYIEKYYALINNYKTTLAVECATLKNNIKHLLETMFKIGAIDEYEARYTMSQITPTNYNIDKLLTTFWTLAGKYKNFIQNTAKNRYGNQLVDNALAFIHKNKNAKADFCPGIALSFYNDFLYYVEHDYTGDKIARYDLKGKVDLEKMPNYKKYVEINQNCHFKRNPIAKLSDNSAYFKQIDTNEGKIYYRVENDNPIFIEYKPNKFKKFESGKINDGVGVINDLSIITAQSDDFLDFMDNISYLNRQ